MKKLWKFRFYGLILTGLVILSIGAFNSETNTGMIVWGIGFIVSFIGVLMQIMFAPNFNNLKCPDCNAKLNFDANNLEFKEHSK